MQGLLGLQLGSTQSPLTRDRVSVDSLGMRLGLQFANSVVVSTEGNDEGPDFLELCFRVINPDAEKFAMVMCYRDRVMMDTTGVRISGVNGSLGSRCSTLLSQQLASSPLPKMAQI